MTPLDFLPILFVAAILGYLFWTIHRDAKRVAAWNAQPEQVLARQKAAYDEAHAYTEGKCPERD